MQIFVTGGTGFLGAHFIRAALAAGHEIQALCRGTPPAGLSGDGPLRWIQGRLTDDHRGTLRTCRALVHFVAAGVSPRHASVSTMFEVNVGDSLRLWSQAIEADVQSMTLCGSCFEYGRSADAYERIPASAPLQPVTCYGVSKAAASLAAIALARETGARIQILRPFTVYGEGQSESNFWPSMRAAAQAGRDFPMTAGAQMRDFIAVEQLANQFVDALGTLPIAGVPAVRNVGSGQARSLLDFATEWWTRWGARGRLMPGAIPYRADEVMRYVPLLDAAACPKGCVSPK